MAKFPGRYTGSATRPIERDPHTPDDARANALAKILRTTYQIPARARNRFSRNPNVSGRGAGGQSLGGGSL